MTLISMFNLGEDLNFLSFQQLKVKYCERIFFVLLPKFEINYVKLYKVFFRIEIFLFCYIRKKISNY